MNEQQIRDDERRKIVHFLESVADEIRNSPSFKDAHFIDAVIEKLNHPNWVTDTEGY